MLLNNLFFVAIQLGDAALVERGEFFKANCSIVIGVDFGRPSLIWFSFSSYIGVG